MKTNKIYYRNLRTYSNKVIKQLNCILFKYPIFDLILLMNPRMLSKVYILLEC